jgi:YD repeat-containing protein
MNRTATREDPLTNDETYTYDNNGNVATVTDRKGQVTTYTVWSTQTKNESDVPLGRLVHSHRR